MNAAVAVERNEENEMIDALQLNDATAATLKRCSSNDFRARVCLISLLFVCLVL